MCVPLEIHTHLAPHRIKLCGTDSALDQPMQVYIVLTTCRNSRSSRIHSTCHSSSKLNIKGSSGPNIFSRNQSTAKSGKSCRNLRKVSSCSKRLHATLPSSSFVHFSQPMIRFTMMMSGVKMLVSLRNRRAADASHSRYTSTCLMKFCKTTIAREAQLASGLLHHKYEHSYEPMSPQYMTIISATLQVRTGGISTSAQLSYAIKTGATIWKSVICTCPSPQGPSMRAHVRWR